MSTAAATGHPSRGAKHGSPAPTPATVGEAASGGAPFPRPEAATAAARARVRDWFRLLLAPATSRSAGGASGRSGHRRRIRRAGLRHHLLLDGRAVLPGALPRHGRGRSPGRLRGARGGRATRPASMAARGSSRCRKGAITRLASSSRARACPWGPWKGASMPSPSSPP